MRLLVPVFGFQYVQLAHVIWPLLCKGVWSSLVSCHMAHATCSCTCSGRNVEWITRMWPDMVESGHVCTGSTYQICSKAWNFTLLPPTIISFNCSTMLALSECSDCPAVHVDKQDTVYCSVVHNHKDYSAIHIHVHAYIQLASLSCEEHTRDVLMKHTCTYRTSGNFSGAKFSRLHSTFVLAKYFVCLNFAVEW